MKQLKKSAQGIFTKVTNGFTLVELLVVIAIIAILAAVVVIIINPVELTRRSRDAARLTDLSNLQQAINVAVQESSESAEDVLCYNVGNPTCFEATFPLGGNTRDPNGTGWVKVNLSSQNAVSVPTLPVDPSNNDDHQYLYCADTTGGASKWQIIAKLESQQQQAKMSNDGGVDDTLYEIGTDFSLLNVMTGCAYSP